MNKCDNELLIIDYLGNELSDEEKSELTDHLLKCPKCRRLLEEYSKIQKGTEDFYSSIDFNQTPAGEFTETGSAGIIRKASIAFSIAASLVIGFLLISQNHDRNDYYTKNTDSINHTIEEPLTVINPSEWNLKLNLLQHKIELIKDEMSQ
jgi:hypothetical protein